MQRLSATHLCPDYCGAPFMTPFAPLSLGLSAYQTMRLLLELPADHRGKLQCSELIILTTDIAQRPPGEEVRRFERRLGERSELQ